MIYDVTLPYERVFVNTFMIWEFALACSRSVLTREIHTQAFHSFSDVNTDVSFSKSEPVV